MRIYFSPRVTITGLILIGLMIRASVWQWDRYQQKLAYIDTLSKRLEMPPLEIGDVIAAAAGKEEERTEQLVHRLVRVRGTYDFANEMVLRNRAYQGMPGVFAITPLHIDETGHHVLVNRGFIPLSLSKPEQRNALQSEPHAEFLGLIKQSQHPRFLAPADPEVGAGRPRLDAWLYINAPEMQKQLPYQVLPIFLEIFDAADAKSAQAKIVAAKEGREEILMPTGDRTVTSPADVRKDLKYPVPVFSTVVPPGRHREYVFEWAFMALLTLLICVVLQLRPRRPIIRS